MKFVGYRSLYLCLALIGILLIPAAADISIPTVTTVYFDKDGIPFNESIQYTVNCTGTIRYPWVTGTPAGDTSGVEETVYSYTASCPFYGCTIHETYYLNYRVIDSCDLVVKTGNATFVLRGFTSNPAPASCTGLHQYDLIEDNQYYRHTPGYLDCRKESDRADRACDRFLLPCQPPEPGCGTRVLMNGTVARESPEYHACRNETRAAQKACTRYLEKADRSTLLMWEDPHGTQTPALRTCVQHYTLSPNSSNPGPVPSLETISRQISDQTRAAPERGPSVTPPPSNPLGSLFCSMIQLIGGGCE
ncbi:MAG: hypothetical protein GYA23_05650 [Methanomicrobiales archaeon]|nr:hypothetical protein [Methanomicrobiales archaeon]